MKLYNIDGTIELDRDNIDLKRGHIEHKTFERYIAEKPEQKEQGHYELINNSNSEQIKWIVDVPAQSAIPAHYEYEMAEVYVPFSEEKILEIEQQEKENSYWNTLQPYLLQIRIYKDKLFDTDYQAIKYAEGAFSEEEYAPIKKQRQEWREMVNKYQKEYDDKKAELDAEKENS